MYVLNLDPTTSRILSASIMPHPPGDAVLVDMLPDGNVVDYLYINGEYVYDPQPEPEPVEPGKSMEQRMEELETMANELMAGIKDKQ